MKGRKDTRNGMELVICRLPLDSPRNTLDDLLLELTFQVGRSEILKEGLKKAFGDDATPSDKITENRQKIKELIRDVAEINNEIRRRFEGVKEEAKAEIERRNVELERKRMLLVPGSF